MAKQNFRVSWIALLLGLIAGLALGLVYAWVLAPVVEYNTQPYQLDATARAQYLAAISLAYRADSDLGRAVERLIALRLPDPFQALADTACGMFQDGFQSAAERNAIEAMIVLYRSQGRTGCADQSGIFTLNQATPTPLPTAIPSTPTLTPPATKTSTPAPGVTPPTAIPFYTPTTPPQQDEYAIVNIPTFCSTAAPGMIEVYVQLPGSGEVPGVEIRVSWDGGEDHFFTGLKPERGLGYADFQMEANRTYIVEIPGHSPRSTALTAGPCTAEDGQRSTISYRVIFRRL